jgi:Base plate wedge protein 53
MKYFETLPKMIMTENGISRVAVNILARTNIVPELLNSPAVFYKYDIQETDTPEIIAQKYYGDTYRYWIVLIANQILDPQWDWPMTGVVFEKYLKTKYGTTNTSNIHHYEKITTQKDNVSSTITTNVTEITEYDYNNLVESTDIYTIPMAGSVTVSTNKRAVTIYEYEYELNESKRSIKLLNKNYAAQIEEQFAKLMS